MTEKTEKNLIEDILDKNDFSMKEKKAFYECLHIIQSQSMENINEIENQVYNKIKEVTDNAISKN